jgi:hypothetical protein
MGDHSETIQVDYNPGKVSYQRLLDIFWESHSPTSKVWSQQYMNFIFTHNREQEQLAHNTWIEVQEKATGKVSTEIMLYKGFYLAEDHHQKHFLQGYYDLADVFKEIYPDFDEFLNSTTIARVNGYIGGYGSLSSVKKEIDMLEISSEKKKKLKKLVSSKDRR